MAAPAVPAAVPMTVRHADASRAGCRYPSLICVNISGYGPENSYTGMKAYDLLVQAELGLCSITGSPEAGGRVGVSVCDISAGMSSHAAVLEALMARVRPQGKTARKDRLSCSQTVSFYSKTLPLLVVQELPVDQGGTAGQGCVIEVPPPPCFPPGRTESSTFDQCASMVQCHCCMRLVADLSAPTGFAVLGGGGLDDRPAAALRGGCMIPRNSKLGHQLIQNN